MTATHGRPVRAEVVDPIPEMQLCFPLPPGEQERLLDKYELRVAARRSVLDPSLAQAGYTAYRAGWQDCRVDALEVAAAEARRGEDPETLRDGVQIEMRRAEPGQVLADVVSRVPDAPGAVGRRRS